MVDLLFGGARGSEIGCEYAVGRSDRRGPFVGRDGEQDPTVVVPKDASPIVIEQAPTDEMVARHEADPDRCRYPHHLLEKACRPGVVAFTSARSDLLANTDALIVEDEMPRSLVAPGGAAAGPHTDRRAALRAVSRIEDREARVVDPAIGYSNVKENAASVHGPRNRRGERGARIRAGSRGRRDGRREKEPEAQQPPQSPSRASRRHGAHGLHDAGCSTQRDLALGRGLAAQARTRTARDSGVRRGRASRKRRRSAPRIVLVDEQHAQTSAAGIASDRAAVDATAYDN